MTVETIVNLYQLVDARGWIIVHCKWCIITRFLLRMQVFTIHYVTQFVGSKFYFWFPFQTDIYASLSNMPSFDFMHYANE